MGVATVALVIGIPALAFTLWPLLRRGGRSRSFLAVPPDSREQLFERKRQLLDALREIEFEHDAGHVSDDDYADLRARYEAETAEVFTDLDRLAPPPRREAAPATVPQPGRGWRHPVALGVGGVALVVFGVAIGAGIVRYTAPDPMAGMPMPGSRPLADAEAPAVAQAAPAQPEGGPPRALSPEMLQGMLQAARKSLTEGRYSEAIAAYQAILKREPQNVDAMTHLGLIVALGGHADAALETFERVLAIDPKYPPALLYRGQILFESKRDREGAIRSWEKFLSVAPAGEDHERVKRLIAEARAQK